MKRFLVLLPLIIALTLPACSPSLASNPPVRTLQQSESSASQTVPATVPVSNVTPMPTDNPALIPTLFPDTDTEGDMTRVDEQGMVMMQVTPLNLGTPADTLEFDVAMNTHSVDLSMDLAALSTLTTDSNITVQPTLWDAPRGGHHVSGKLIFPAVQDGKSILDGATKLTLTITDVDAPSRVFEWDLK